MQPNKSQSELSLWPGVIIILITWENHHSSLRLIHKSYTSFIYANGFFAAVGGISAIPDRIAWWICNDGPFFPCGHSVCLHHGGSSVGMDIHHKFGIEQSFGENEASIVIIHKNRMTDMLLFQYILSVLLLHFGFRSQLPLLRHWFGSYGWCGELRSRTNK